MKNQGPGEHASRPASPRFRANRNTARPLFYILSDARLFADRPMRDDPARSWTWTQQAVESGAIGSASEDEIITVFERLAAEPAAGSGAAGP